MKNYEKPVVLVNEDVTEGVYAASGCYSTTWTKHQVVQNGRINYKFQINAVHNAEHTCNKQRWTVTFSTAVDGVEETNGDTSSVTGIGTNVIQYYTGYWNNEEDNIGAGNLTVTTPGDVDVDIIKIVVEDQF